MWNKLNRGGIRILDLTVIMVGQDWMTELKKEEGNLTVCVSDSPATTSIRIIVSHAVDNEKTRGRDLWASTQNGVGGGVYSEEPADLKKQNGHDDWITLSM